MDKLRKAVKIIPLSAFHQEGNHLSADASDLGGRFKIEILWLDDHRSAGFAVCTNEGRVIPFLLVKREIEEGAVTAWRFESLGGNYTATVFND